MYSVRGNCGIHLLNCVQAVFGTHGLAVYMVLCAEFAELILQCICVYKTLTSVRGKCVVNTAVATRSVVTSASAPTATDLHPIIAPVKVC